MAAAVPEGLTPRARYVLTPPDDTRPSLLVELCPALNDDVLNDLRLAMIDDGCANGIALDPERTVILRDTYASMDRDSIAEEFPLNTQQLLPGDAALDIRLERWLDRLTTNWHAAIPREKWAAPLLTDVVPAAAGTIVRRMRGAGRGSTSSSRPTF